MGVFMFDGRAPAPHLFNYSDDYCVSGQLRAPVGRELVLDYIVERKRMDDLCGSIIDGRFREQKVGVQHGFIQSSY